MPLYKAFYQLIHDKSNGELSFKRVSRLCVTVYAVRFIIKTEIKISYFCYIMKGNKLKFISKANISHTGRQRL